MGVTIRCDRVCAASSMAVGVIVCVCCGSRMGRHQHGTSSGAAPSAPFAAPWRSDQSNHQDGSNIRMFKRVQAFSSVFFQSSKHSMPCSYRLQAFMPCSYRLYPTVCGVYIRKHQCALHTSYPIARARTHTHIHTYTHTYTYTHIHTHTYTNTHTYTHTDTYTHTHIYTSLPH